MQFLHHVHGIIMFPVSTLQKERDLELAARIGQNLLEKNQDIETQKERLEELLAEANERVSLNKSLSRLIESVINWLTKHPLITLSPLYRPVPPALGSPFLRLKSPS